MRRVKGQDLLKPYLVAPQVIEIILVEKALVDAKAEVGEAKEGQRSGRPFRAMNSGKAASALAPRATFVV